MMNILRMSLPHPMQAHAVWAVLLALLLVCHAGRAADFTVKSPGYYYSINGSAANPTLTLVRGKTYTFQVSTAFNHPFYIQSDGVQNNNISSGTITYTVPMTAANHTYYCSVHGFGGAILTVAPTTPPPPTPPKIRLLSLSLGSNVVVRSTGTNTWSVQPEYSTNLTTTNWYSLTVLTNRYMGGTNETICGRPPVPGAFIRIKSTAN